MKTLSEIIPAIRGNPQNLISSPRESQRLALSEHSESRDRLDELLAGCMALQKLYGRDVANSGTIIDLFQKIMAEYPAQLVIKAVETWLEKSQEFPTPADIIGLIKRNGKPPLKESDVIAVRKKEAELRTGDDWQLLRDWDHQQSDGWSDGFYDTAKEESKDAEITRLRVEIQELRRENGRAWAEVKSLRSLQPIPSHEIGLEERIKNTVDDMRARGAPEKDIEEFLEAFAA